MTLTVPSKTHNDVFPLALAKLEPLLLIQRFLSSRLRGQGGSNRSRAHKFDKSALAFVTVVGQL
jgi:hypothetical protein